MIFEAESTYPCRSTTPAHARSWSQERILAAIPEHPGAVRVLDDAAIVVSELVTNAVQAGCGVARLTLVIDEDLLRIGVLDDVGGVPAMRDSGPEDLHGHGLKIVDALCEDWGVERTRSGKKVWAVLPF